jgi:hypothetical protein
VSIDPNLNKDSAFYQSCYEDWGHILLGDDRKATLASLPTDVRTVGYSHPEAMPSLTPHMCDTAFVKQAHRKFNNLHAEEKNLQAD